MKITFQDWTLGRKVSSLGTNNHAPKLPFQNWYHFKEAFAPELVYRAVQQSDIRVNRCLDPFGGSGTTALACQFLGVQPITVEVNPFLADLIEAKLMMYDTDALTSDFGAIMKSAAKCRINPDTVLAGLPRTFVEPGKKGRWIFDISVAVRIASLLAAIGEIQNEAHRRLFRILLASILIDVSNVVISGKGRRYRRGWQRRKREPLYVDMAFCDVVQNAISDIHRYAQREDSRYKIWRGDSRTGLWEPAHCELAVFSPPYPNSFDYTDVYNIELWTLGYLTDSESNRILRTSTFCSHVQIGRTFPPPPSGSIKLNRTLESLTDRRDKLWDNRIPEMVGSYFADMMAVLDGIYRSLAHKGSVWMVVGDSCYADVQVNVADILVELAQISGWLISTVEPCRSMRTSAQQGGRSQLAETLVILSKN